MHKYVLKKIRNILELRYWTLIKNNNNGLWIKKHNLVIHNNLRRKNYVLYSIIKSDIFIPIILTLHLQCPLVFLECVVFIPNFFRIFENVGDSIYYMDTFYYVPIFSDHSEGSRVKNRIALYEVSTVSSFLTVACFPFGRACFDFY